MALLNKVIVCHLLFLVEAIHMDHFPCRMDNSTIIDCSHQPICKVPVIKSTSLEILILSWTKIRHLTFPAFANMPNLQTLEIVGNCLPGELRPPNDSNCILKIEQNAFRNLRKLQTLYLSKNSLDSLPWLPESLLFLDLQMNNLHTFIDPLPTPHLERLLLNKNCFYANPCHQSFQISERFFSTLPKLKVLNLSYNNLTAVPKMLPPSLTDLNLKENRITEIMEGAFSNLTLLQKLNLGWNCQRCDHAAMPCFPCPGNQSLALHKNSFYSENSSITYLSLRGNSLKTFPKGMFLVLKNLQRLDLSDNLLACAIQNDTFFEELRGLVWISLIYNYEPELTFQEFKLSPYFSRMSRLKYLLLSGNFFHSLSNQSLDILTSLQNLITLELRMNFITSFYLTALKLLPSLNNIDLSENKLQFLPNNFNFSNVINAREHCQNLAIKNNLDFPRFVRDREETLTSSDLGTDQSNVLQIFEENQLQIPVTTLDGNVAIEPSKFKHIFCKNKLTINLSENDIFQLNKNVLTGLENAVCLDLSLNYINQALTGGAFENLKNLVFLNMSYNRIDLYYAEAFSELKSTLKVLDISYNEFYFQMRGMGQHFKFLHHLDNLEVLSLANNGIGVRIDQTLICKSLKYMYFNGNHLDYMWQFGNNKYTYFFQNLTNLIYLDISDNNLVSVSSEVLLNLPRSLKNLIISQNLLNYFPWHNISTLRNLSHLNLSFNSLSSLPLTAVQFGANFSQLDLSHNSLTYIPELFFSQADSLSFLYLDNNKIQQINHYYLPAPFKNGSALLKLTLHANPFECNCDSSELSDFLRRTSVRIPFLNRYLLCEFPESEQGKSILSIDQRSCQDIYGSCAFVISCFLAVVFTVFPVLHHLYSWDIWYGVHLFWAGHKGYSKMAGSNSLYHYDAFVVFDTANYAVRDWVYNELMVNLENTDQKRFCLCLEERDWLPGLSCIENLHNAVHHSLKTVFVLSKGVTVSGVIRQAFFMVQQRLLDEKVDTAVLVLLDESFPKFKYLNLRKRLCKKSVLSWPRNPKAQPLFWNQMRIALSSDIIKLYDNKMSESFFWNLYKYRK